VPPQFNPGQIVKMRNNPRFGTIVGNAQPMGNTWSYRIQWNSGTISSALESDLLPIEDSSPESLFLADSFSDHRSLLRLVTWTRLNKALTDTVLTRFANRIDFLPYQWMPLLKFLDSTDQRILIADEVGLGKTIEAGIILRELTARSARLRKVLVIGRKGSLNSQWIGELKGRFGFEFTAWEAQDLLDWLEMGRQDNYWADAMRIVGRNALSSSQTLFNALENICTIKTSNHREFAHPDIGLDLLVIDESHHTRNKDTNLHKAVSWLARCAKSVIFLTATPIHLDNNDLYNQLRILLPLRYPDYGKHNPNNTNCDCYFCNDLKIHKDVILAIKQIYSHQKAELKGKLEDIANGDDISDIIGLLDGLDKPAIRAELKRKIEYLSPLSNVIQRTTRRDIPNEWPARNAISLIHDLTDKEKNFYLQLLTEHFEAIRNGLPFGKSMKLRLAATCMPIAMTAYQNTDEFDGEDDSECTDERGETILAIDDDTLSKLAPVPDSRFDKLVEAFQTIWSETPNSKIIVFSFFVDVLRYLSERLKQKGITHSVVYGRGMSMEQRNQGFACFLDPNSDIKVLLCSEIGSEGLNLQVADTIINYNLPWNPMVVEQRIGRIDRQGQRAKVLRIVNLFANGTIEEQVLQRLWDRIEIFKSSIGDLEPILGNIESKIAREFANPDLTEEQRRLRAVQLADQLELEQANQRRLEDAARDRLVADLPFNPVNELISEGRYITAEQMKLLVEGFLTSDTSQSRMEDNGDGTFTIIIAQDLLNVIVKERNNGDHNQEEVYRMNRYSNQGQFKVTFNASETGTPLDSQLEYIAPGHWFVRAICRAIDARPASIHPVSAMRLRTAQIPRGFYAYGLFVHLFKGLKDRKLFEPIFLDLQNQSFLEPSLSHILLNTMLVNSEYMDVRIVNADYNREHCLNMIRTEFLSIYNQNRQDFESETERHKRLRRLAEEKYAKAEIERIEATIAGLQTEEQRQILPALQQNIRNLQTRRANALAELNQIQITAEFINVGYGLLKVEE